jgi:hypothetical protein
VTATPAHGQDPAEDEWLATRHRDLCEGLSRLLNLDTGLRESTMLHAEHQDLLGNLGISLDTRAGLGAILPPPAAATLQTRPSLPDLAAAVAGADLAVRMSLRRNPVILAVILSDLTVRALMIADEAVHDCYAEDLIRDLARDLALDFPLDLAPDFPFHLTLELVELLGPNRDVDYALAAHSLAQDLARPLARALDQALPPFDHTVDLVLVDDLSSALTLVRVGDRKRALPLAREIADETAHAVGHALGVRQVEGLATALLDGVLDDFTRADLTQADLTGRDLTGVRWSDWGTRWPPGTDIDRLRARSREIAHDAGIYVIKSPEDSDKTLHAPA